MFNENDDDVFRMALTRLPVEYRTYWPLKAFGLPRQFHSEENMKVALEDKNSRRYRNFIKQLKIVFSRDERLYNFVCESIPSDALEGIKTLIGEAAAMRGTGDVIDGSCSEVYEPGLLVACREIALPACMTRNGLCSSRICDRTRSRRRGCLVSWSSGMFAGVARNVKGCSHVKGCSAIYVCVLDTIMYTCMVIASDIG